MKNVYAPAHALNKKLSQQQVTEHTIKEWALPYVEDSVKEDVGKTNAFNKTSDWKYEPPEEEPEIVPPTLEEIEAIRKAAYDEGFEQGKLAGYEEGKTQGYQEGLAQGHAEGMENGRQEGLAEGQGLIEHEVGIWQSLSDKLHSPLNSVSEQLQAELILLSVSLARSVLGVELQTNTNVIFQALSDGLKVLPIAEKNYQIFLNPDDVELIKNHFSEEEIEKHKWHLVVSPDMQRGGCEIVTNTNAVDVSVEKRTRDVIDRFLIEQAISATSSKRDQ